MSDFAPSFETPAGFVGQAGDPFVTEMLQKPHCVVFVRNIH
jgi:hypothetical protein